MQYQANLDLSVPYEDTSVKGILTMMHDMINSVPITAANK